MDFGDEIDDDALMAMMDSTEAGAAAAPAAAEHDVSLGALQRTMREVFGFDTFRPGQLGCARAVLAGRDAAVFMATGSGKSLCYQLPAFHVERATVLVVSPLISLMEDQVAALEQRGVRAGYLGSAQADGAGVERAARAGELALLYVTPERAAASAPLLRAMHAGGGVALFAVDESHCVSEWGHDFRPAYQALGDALRGVLPDVPVVALTATATEGVRGEIARSLALRSPLRVVTTFNRPNLFYAAALKSAAAGVGAARAAELEMPPIEKVFAPPSVTAKSSARALRVGDALAAKGARMYGAYWCSHCFGQKQTLGKEAFSRIEYVECAKDGAGSRNALCKSRKVPGYPTWEIDGVLHPGEATLEELEALVGLAPP